MQVPELCRMNGIIIKMMNMDVGQHSKPHIHVYYGEYQASISLNCLQEAYLQNNLALWLRGSCCVKMKCMQHGRKQ